MATPHPKDRSNVASFEENYLDVIMRAWNGQLEFAQLLDCAGQLEARKLAPLSAVLYQTLSLIHI